MNPQTIAAENLHSWLDIERLLKQKTSYWKNLPSGVKQINCYPDGLEILHVSSIGGLDDWLKDIFDKSYSNEEKRSIRIKIGNSNYPVELIEVHSADLPVVKQNYPLWRHVTYLPDGSNEIQGESVLSAKGITPPSRFSKSPDLISFHSFKGGVGRTTALMTYVAACLLDRSSSTKKILVVDADLEAPGVSFWLDETNRPTVSFIRLLEALHYPPNGIDATLDFFADELRKTSLSLGSLDIELFILPAALNLSEIQDMPVVPEHLARNTQNPWQLSDHIHSLGERLGVDAVFIDLRAGLSELASPILFDPRIDHFFVSTVAPQSVQGMAEVLHRLYSFNHQLPLTWQDETRPTVIISLLTKELRESEYYQNALKIFSSAYPSNDDFTPSVVWLEAEFINSLMSIGSVRDALNLLPQSSQLFSSATEWANALYSRPNQLELLPQSTATSDLSALRQNQTKELYKVCLAAEFAEGEQDNAILVTEPLLNLGKHFSNELPNILMIGAKGAGKTFTFRQVVKTKSWQLFLKKLGFDEAKITDASIFPVLWSNNIVDKPGGEIKQAQLETLQKIEIAHPAPLTGTQIKIKIDAAIKSPPQNWGFFWEEMIASQLGFPDGSLSEINESLITKSTRILLVFDGIEDAFKDAADPIATDAIQELLFLTNRINELTNPHLGAIIFVRIDYVQTTIRQNLGQWLQRFHPFRLQWDAISFLRLAYTICQQAEVIHSKSKAESLGVDELKTELEQLWGKKLGTPKSKEAHSARWVYAALCDLKGNVQARDLVRFLRFAADEESNRNGQTLPGRVLAPESMRKAIPRCSEEKVSEAKTEIAALRRWDELMTENNIKRLKIPFSANEAKLDPQLLRALQELGVIYEDVNGNLGEECLFLPEIYRHGLGFETSVTGRPRMQALLKKNIGNIPL